MSFIMPGRRTTTNLIQASGELWEHEEQEAPLRFTVLAGGPATEPRVAAVIGAMLQLAPDDVSLEPLTIDDLPAFGDDGPDAVVPEPVERFQDDLTAADAVVLLASVADAPAIGTLVRALQWAATPAGEDALTGLPIAWLGLAGDASAATEARRQITGAVEAGGGVLIDPAGTLTEPLTGDWDGRLGPGARLEDLATRQAIGQALMRLREVVLTVAEPAPATTDGGDPADA